MIKYEKEMNNILSALNESGMLSQCIISGSWAMYFYQQIFEGFVPPIATTDFDLFLPKASKIKNNNISKLLIDLDYIREDDYMTGKTRYYSKDGFEIEFLTLPDRTMNKVIIIPSIGIGAEALPKMAIAQWNYVTVDYNSLKVNIPSPASYCLQKLLINKERSVLKQEKDIDSIKYVLTFVNASQKYSQEFVESFESAPKKWKKAIKEIIDKYNLITPIL